MPQHRGFPTMSTSDSTTARSRSRLRERPTGRERERARVRRPQPAPRADPPGASGQRIPRFARDATTSVAGRRVPEASGSPGPKREKRWREGTFTLARQPARYCRQAARNGRSRATRRAAAASGAGRDVHTCPVGRDTRPAIHRPGGLRKGEAASVVPRPRKHRRDEERSGGRGMPSGRGLSGIVSVDDSGRVTGSVSRLARREGCRRRPS